MRTRPGSRRTATSPFGTKGRISHDASLFYSRKLYYKPESVAWDGGEEVQMPPELLNKIFHSSSENMEQLPDRSVNLMITSPPYNVAKAYDLDLSLDEYLSMLTRIFRECYRVLINGGRACINVANVGRKPYLPLAHFITKIMTEIGFNMRGEIIWNKSASAGPSTAWGSWQSASNPSLRDVHEYILVFSKGDYKRSSENKVNTISRDQFLEWTKSIWTMNTESARKVGHPAPFPEELPYRLLQLYSFQEDLILDPFMGSGTTAVAAIKSNRKYIGYEVDADYVQLAEERIKKALII